MFRLSRHRGRSHILNPLLAPITRFSSLASVISRYRVATSRATGSSTRQTFSARIFCPAAFG